MIRWITLIIIVILDINNLVQQTFNHDSPDDFFDKQMQSKNFKIILIYIYFICLKKFVSSVKIPDRYLHTIFQTLC